MRAWGRSNGRSGGGLCVLQACIGQQDHRSLARAPPRAKDVSMRDLVSRHARVEGRAEAVDAGDAGGGDCPAVVGHEGGAVAFFAGAGGDAPAEVRDRRWRM